MQVYGSFYRIYKEEHYYWELFVTFRRLILAFVVALTPYDNPVSLKKSTDNYDKIHNILLYKLKDIACWVCISCDNLYAFSSSLIPIYS